MTNTVEEKIATATAIANSNGYEVTPASTQPANALKFLFTKSGAVSFALEVTTANVYNRINEIESKIGKMVFTEITSIASLTTIRHYGGENSISTAFNAKMLTMITNA